MLLWFIVFLVVIVGVGFWAGRAPSKTREGYLLDDRSLGPIATGISAAATGNSGFIMLGAVGLGYSFGLTWVCLPLAWLIGDLVFWALFPHRMNTAARAANAATLPELLLPATSPGWRAARAVVALLMIAVVSTYGAAQVLAGSKTLGTLFDLTQVGGAMATVVIVGVYSLWGGFRASVWTDLVQAAVMGLLTLVALVAVAFAVFSNAEHSTALLESGHLTPFDGVTLPIILGFAISWATAGVGFGLSQPQVVSRYFASADEATVRRAKWVYIVFLQFTWAGMTTFGVLVHGIVQDLEDPEVALLAFARNDWPDIGVAFVLAGVFSAIMSTLDSVILAVGGIVSSDLVPAARGQAAPEARTAHVVGATAALVGVFLVAAASSLNVFELSVLPVELVAASIGPVVAAHLLFGRRAAVEIVVAVGLGVVGVLLWRQTQLEPMVSSAVVGLGVFALLAVKAKAWGRS